MHRHVAALVASVLFLAAMAAFFLSYDPFTSGGPKIVPPLDFSSSTVPPPWQLAPRNASVEAGALRLDCGSGKRDGGTLLAEIDAPQRFQAVRVRARLRTERVVLGEYGWDTTRLILFFTDAAGQAHWEHPHSVCNFSGTHPWTVCEAVIRVPPFGVAGHALVGNAAARGIAWVDDLSLTACTEKPGAWRPQALFAIGWAACALWSCMVLRLWHGLEGLSLICLATAIVIGVLIPDQMLTSTGRRAIEHWIAWKAPPAPASSPSPTASSPPTAIAPKRTEVPAANPFERIRELKKYGHAVLFAVLGVVSMWARRRRRAELLPVPMTIAALLVFAAATEIAQFLTTTRSPLLSDFVIDAGGAMIGFTAAWAVLSQPHDATRE